MLPAVEAAEEHWYRAVESRDSRFDGWIYLGVTSTGIYCRPSCPAVSPEARQHALLPQLGGGAASGLPGLQALPARRLARLAGVERARRRRRARDAPDRRRRRRPRGRRRARRPARLQRAPAQPRSSPRSSAPGPLALARAQRAQTARTLIETTELGVRRGRVRRRLRERAPVQRHRAGGLRAHAARAAAAARQAERRRRRARSRCACRSARRSRSTSCSRSSRTRAIAGVEESDGAGAYRRTLRLPHGTAIAELAPGDGCVQCSLRLADVRDLGVAVARCRRLLDLDADPIVGRRGARERSAARAARRRAPGPARPGLRRRHRDRGARRARPADLRRGRAHARRAASCSATASRWQRPTDR